MLRSVLILALCCLAVHAEKKSYAGYKVLKTEPLTHGQAAALDMLQARFDFWKNPAPGMSAEVMAAPSDVVALEAFLLKHGVRFVPKILDVQALIEEVEKPVAKHRSAPSSRASILGFDEYLSHNEMIEYMETLASTCSWCSTFDIGQTYEGRSIIGLAVEKAGPGAKNVMIEAGIHAREWIAPAVALYTMSQIVEEYDSNGYADNINFYIIPSANPDGYEYSRTDERLWRKNRKVNPQSPAGCIGTDLNRNFGYHWGESGVGTTYCSDTWPGDEPFSDLEAQHLRDFYATLDPVPEIAICFHSAAELWLYPYGYAKGPTQNDPTVITLAEDAVDALNALNGQRFEVINSADLYPAAGASDDYYASEGSRFVYTPELRDNGFGFVLPPSLILPSGEEVWEAWKVMLDFILAN